MNKSFTDALTVVLKEEGGFSNDANDPGGMTNLGVTARIWQQWTGKAPTEQSMRALMPHQVGPLYKAWYWDKIGGDELPSGLGLCAFDFAINVGPIHALKILQGICGSPADGLFGRRTLFALQAYITGIGMRKLIIRFGDARRDYYRELPTFARFGGGWLARVDRIEAEALSWLG